VSVFIDGKRWVRGVHQLVADAFKGPRPDGLVCNHKNGVKTDNRPQNLEYVTYAENCRHAHRNGLTPQPPVGRGARNGRARLTEKDVRAARRRAAAGERGEDLAREFGVCRSALNYAVSGHTWAHVPGAVRR